MKNIFNTIRVTICFIAMAISSLFSMNLYADEFSITENSGNAVVSDVNGYVTVTDSEGNVRRLSKDDEISPGDIINTGNASSVNITLADGQVLVLGELRSYTYAPTLTGPASNLAGGGSNNGKSLSNSSSSLSTSVSAGGSPTF